MKELGLLDQFLVDINTEHETTVIVGKQCACKVTTVAADIETRLCLEPLFGHQRESFVVLVSFVAISVIEGVIAKDKPVKMINTSLDHQFRMSL